MKLVIDNLKFNEGYYSGPVSRSHPNEKSKPGLSRILPVYRYPWVARGFHSVPPDYLIRDHELQVANESLPGYSKSANQLLSFQLKGSLNVAFFNPFI
jgi:hypothetical protein